MPQATIIVRADWDEEAKVWVASSADIDGLATEADTFDQLKDKVVQMVRELIELNGLPDEGRSLPEIPVQIMAQHLTLVPNPRHSQ